MAPGAPGALAGEGAASAEDAPRLDGRRVHIVDRALDYVALAGAGLTAARIAKKRRRSAGYVSILLRLGQAIAGLEPAELAALRSPRVTWKLAQRIVRTDADVGSVRHQLRLALGGFSTHNVDRRQHRVRRAPAGGGAPRPGGGGAAWGWDEAWFTRDPLDYVRHHLAHLAAVHRTVETRARRHGALQSARRLSVGQSLTALQRSLASAASREGGGEGATQPDARALAALALLERHLTAAGAAMAALLAEGAGAEEAPAAAPVAPRAPVSRPAATRPPVSRPAATPLAEPASALEIDEDLA